MTEKNYNDSHEGDNMMIDKWAAFVEYIRMVQMAWV